jgi:ADP-ribosyl-[dinitrogen reductase] hydrolase
MTKVIGSLLGAAFGDAAGARLEFADKINFRELEKAMNLEGGGVFKVAPGQVTDDTELSIQLFRALLEYKHNKNPDLQVDDFISKRYSDWFNSRPFDIGQTTRNAFQGVSDKEDMVENSRILNSQSESNGALMRSVPLAVYSFENSLSEDEIYELVTLDVALTHGKKTVANLVFLYVMIIIYLYKNLDWKAIQSKLETIRERLDDVRLDNIFNKYKNYNNVDIYKQMGWDTHAFSLVLYCLEHKFAFTDAIRFVLSKGGDTDTNAAIVGGVMGAKYGLKAIPHLDKLLDCIPNHNRQNFHPKVYVIYFQNNYPELELNQTLKIAD